ncbi:MAG: D-alanyl-D-alanine carboxypeptidase/D-alanyl-D-alanine-endopeptidase [Bacteroidetes bacterium]|nr:D-alanyl-D-alanine carboxypeptidase/D-alanyl-D-alanine-endopeptidase [Bacteroidota bacterium]MBU1114148.1 D-alanyl-D-alanine carboxypeptidase/D-alanyl-D-alanine-endopeptidase [Bacteroidota bacterium]MBU1796825.1 D-alanyl-D-alanine carboxypeptidase/D-alanyl-D-alanine-endopeptidase [Bacteroidota bacterium]
MERFKLLFLLPLFFFGCSSSTNLNSLNTTHNMIDNKFQDTMFANAHWGVLVESLTTGKIWYEQNMDKLFMPASNEKIPTAASALIILGPEFTFETSLYYSGEIIDSVLKGDLIIKGNGDPTFYTKFFDNPKEPLINWADSLLKLGIKEIDGNIIGDDNAFEDNGYGNGWSYDGLDSWYSAESGALQFNENYVDLTIIPPTRIKDSVIIIPNIESNYFSIINKTTVSDTGKTRISVDRPFGTNNIIVSGIAKTGSKAFERTPTISNPTLFYVTVLMETLINKGISVTGNTIDCDDIENWELDSTNCKLILCHHSPALKEILKGMMKRSQNMYAETMTKILGWNESGIGSFKEGKKVVEKVLADFGIEPKTYAYTDGSGLSRYDYISPHQIVKILKGMRNSEYWDTWKDLLPIAGVDGTLKNRMKGTKAEGNVRAKTGTIANTRGLSGYLTTADGEEIVFSFLINGHLRSSEDTELITDSVLSIIAEHSSQANK